MSAGGYKYGDVLYVTRVVRGQVYFKDHVYTSNNGICLLDTEYLVIKGYKGECLQST